MGPQHDEEVASGEGEGCRSRRHTRTLDLELGLGADDGVEGVAGEGEVDVRVTLGVVEVVGGDQHRGVAPTNEAVMEEEAEGASVGGLGIQLIVHHHIRHDLLHLGHDLA